MSTHVFHDMNPYITDALQATVDHKGDLHIHINVVASRSRNVPRPQIIISSEDAKTLARAILGSEVCTRFHEDDDNLLNAPVIPEPKRGEKYRCGCLLYTIMQIRNDEVCMHHPALGWWILSRIDFMDRVQDGLLVKEPS
jgi:hypothetical protein